MSRTLHFTPVKSLPRTWRVIFFVIRVFVKLFANRLPVPSTCLALINIIANERTYMGAGRSRKIIIE